MTNAAAPAPSTSNEADLVAEFRAVSERHYDLVRKLEAHFMGLAQAAETAQDFDDLIRRCPDDLVRVFLMDAKRQYLGSLEEAARAAELAGELEVR